MDSVLTAIEMTGTVDQQRRLQLDKPLPFAGPARVKVIVLYPLAEEISESEWLSAAARNPAFAHLRESSEDIYTLADGKPFYDNQA
jgi:hypothetical protein